MKKIITFLSLLLPLTVSATQLDYQCPQFTVYGAPIAAIKNTEFICHKGFSLEYDKTAKVTMYVNAHITADMLVDRFVRQNDFRVDPLQNSATRVSPKDYNRAYDRGHIVAADNFTGDKDLLSESFLMSNIHHQTVSNNRGIWKKIENRERKLVTLYGEVYSTTGTIYSKMSKKVGARLDVTVPDAEYKIIFIPKSNSFESYYVPNVEYKGKTDILKFKKSVKEIEKMSGINFNPQIDTTLEQ